MLAERQQLTEDYDLATLTTEQRRGERDVAPEVKRDHDRVIDEVSAHVDAALLKHLTPIHEDIGFIKGTLKAYGERIAHLDHDGGERVTLIKVASRIANSRGFIALVVAGTIVVVATILINHETLSSIWNAAGGR